MWYLLYLAQTIDASAVGIPERGGDALFDDVLNIFYFLAAVVAVIVIIIAGLRYTTSGGDSGKITTAKNQILYAVIGLIVIAAAFAITNFVIGAF